MEVCGEPHVTTSYTRGKSPCYRFSRSLSPQVRSGRFGGEESLLPLPEFDPLTN